MLEWHCSQAGCHLDASVTAQYVVLQIITATGINLWMDGWVEVSAGAPASPKDPSFR